MVSSPDYGRLQVFAKAPVDGHVKTRLQPGLTPAQSAAIHKVLVEHTLTTACAVEGLIVELWVGEEHSWWGELKDKHNVAVFPQYGSSLGERMANALADGLCRSDKVLLIGTDCPFITADYLQQAIKQLASRPVVLGPADDGGYVLIGSSGVYPGIFTDVEWGSHKVLKQTRENLRCAAIDWAELGSLSDIDRVEDLQQANVLMPGLFRQLDFMSGFPVLEKTVKHW